MGCQTGYHGRRWLRVPGAVVWRHMPGMCHGQSPHRVFNRINVDMNCIYAGVLSLQVRMCWVIMATVMIVGLIQPRLDSHPACLLWCEREPILPWYSSTLALSAIHIGCYMTRPRGTPRRGAPWQPRRPSHSPLDTSSDDSPPHLQTDSPPVNLQPSQIDPMAIVPNTSVTFCRILHNPGPSLFPTATLATAKPLRDNPVHQHHIAKPLSSEHNLETI
jgi:hypothetical protein